ncbi:MAG: hypothetical protein MZV63_70005 [Marinilabiliales bacterium]|nr:hypothetical protein [Marinilabiliales bacterium]
MNDWFNSKDQPGFLITDLQAKEIIVGDRIRYQVTFVASNPELVAGIFQYFLQDRRTGRRQATEE